MKIQLTSINGLEKAAQQLLDVAGEHKVWLFYGDMGAGKTTLIKAICRQLGITDTVSSPTFSIVNEYASPQGPVYHFDFYRLKTESEALDLGYEDYLYSGNYCFIEWPEKISNLLPQNTLNITISLSGDTRIIEVKSQN